MKRSKITILLFAILVPLVYALFMRGIFGIDDWSRLFSVMTISFIFLLPAAVGALTVVCLPLEKVKKFAWRFFMPWVPILAFFALTLLSGIEGWACWIMILPVFLLAASLGGIVAGHFKLRKKNEKINVSLMAFLPLLISPLEQAVGSIPGVYEAYTYIDIHAPAEKIWSNVTRVRTIAESEDKGWFTRFLGFPRPIRAELDHEGTGGFRKAVFDKGLVFDETVTEYIPLKKMVFAIKANPHEIPSTTMDRHILVGGDYFDVLDGTYELQQLHDGVYRLHLHSRFKISTTFNFYAGWWSKQIMKDIQQNILKVIRHRAEDAR